jgi:hypothetical protein
MSEAAIPTFSLASLLPPFHEIKLPSAGQFDASVPEVINVRALTVKELKHITANGKFDRKVFDRTLAACIKEPINLSSLTVEDYNYIVYMIRLYSNGSKVSTVKVCDNANCRNQFKFDYDISECATVDYAEAPIEKTKTVTLPRFQEEHGLNIQVEVKRLLRKDILAIEDTLRQQTELAAKDGTKGSVFPLLEYLKTYIVSITGFPVPIPKDQVLDIFSTEDAEIITTAFDNVVFGVKGSVKTECPFCHKQNEYDVPFTDVFFL